MSDARLVCDEAASVLRVEGPMTLATAADLAAQMELLEGQYSSMRIDLSAVDHADSAGLAVLVDWLATAQARGWGLRFEAAPPQLLAIARVSGVFELLGLASGDDGAADGHSWQGVNNGS